MGGFFDDVPGIGKDSIGAFKDNIDVLNKLFGRRGSECQESGVNKLKSAIEAANKKGYKRKEEEEKVPIFLLGGPKDRQRELVSPREVQQYMMFDDALYERMGSNASGAPVFKYSKKEAPNVG